MPDPRAKKLRDFRHWQCDCWICRLGRRQRRKENRDERHRVRESLRATAQSKQPEEGTR